MASEIDDIEMDKIESSFANESMDELAHCNRDTINPSVTDLGLITEEMTDDKQLSELNNIHILVTEEPRINATSPSLDPPPVEDNNSSAIISDDEDDNPIAIRGDEADSMDVAHQINTVLTKVLIMMKGLSWLWTIGMSSVGFWNWGRGAYVASYFFSLGC